MNSTHESDEFFRNIGFLVSQQAYLTKGKDVVLLVGGTGIGKSVILNMLASSKLTAS
jgi:putative ribosome biogenesis GTPase RsgA